MTTFFFLQVPGAQNQTNPDFEPSVTFSLMDVPEVINIFNKDFVIAGLIAFKPPLVDGDIGHYVCMSKLNSNWEVFDDNNSKNSSVNKSAKSYVIIHTLMYVTSEKK